MNRLTSLETPHYSACKQGQEPAELTAAPRLQIRFNTCSANAPCVLCGESTDPGFGPCLFLEGTYTAVCPECEERQAPDLRALAASWDGTAAHARRLTGEPLDGVEHMLRQAA